MSVQGDDAAILRLTGGGFQVLSTDHLRAFIEDPVQMTRIAAVHALGDIWAMGAAPQTALATVIVPRMSPALQRRTLAEINATAADVFAQAGAAVVGGHTTMGAELTIGFSVTGTRSEPPITLAGAQAGDLLVLTRPIGTGVILAAYMAGRAPPRILSQTFAQMEHPQTTAADVLRHAHAMTDVTGFGLAGHVQAICRASAVRAELWHNAIPLYEGARALSAQGIASSLFATNAADAPVEGVREPLVHDPQTAGGLLAALPEAEAHEAIGALKSRGGTGWIIGRILKGTGLTRLITQ
jgi:selenide,water dikinase